MKEVVVDSNVFVSALISHRGAPRAILFKIAFSRPKLRLLIPESRISDLVTLIHQSARIVKPSIVIKACRDAKDNCVLECALAARVSTVISGDFDLLFLSPFRGISIVSPRSFLTSFKVA
jgi:predicted nucleic acid-binding protein